MGRNALFPTYLLVRYKEGEKKGVNKSTHIATGLPVSPLSFSALYFPKWREGDSGRGYFEGGKKKCGHLNGDNDDKLGMRGKGGEKSNRS